MDRHSHYALRLKNISKTLAARALDQIDLTYNMVKSIVWQGKWVAKVP